MSSLLYYLYNYVSHKNSEKKLYIFEKGLWTDCSFIVEKEVIKAHKLILAAASPVFAKMFFGDDRPGDDCVPIEDMKKSVFLKLLRYLYSGISCVNGDIEFACELYYGILRFNIANLKSQAKQEIYYNLTTGNVCLAYEWCLKWHEEDVTLKRHLINIIVLFMTEVLKSRYFLKLKPATIEKIFSLKNLHGCNEVYLINASIKYLENYFEENCDAIKDESEKVEIVRMLFGQIRFLTLSEDDLRKLPGVLGEATVEALCARRLDPAAPLPAIYSTCAEPRPALALHQLTTLKWCSQILPLDSLEDVKRTESYMRITIDNVTEKTMAISQPFYLQALPMRIAINKGFEKWCLFFKCDTNVNVARDYYIEALVLSHKQNTRPFYNKSNEKWYSAIVIPLLPLTTILDPMQGYLNDDGAVIIELHIARTRDKINTKSRLAMVH